MNTALQKLDLSNNNISDDGMIRDCLKDNDTLKELNLSDTCICKEGLKLISETLHSRKYTKTVLFPLHKDQIKLSVNQTPSLNEIVIDNILTPQQINAAVRAKKMIIDILKRLMRKS